LSEVRSSESDELGDKVFKSAVSVLKVSMLISILLKMSESVKSLPRPESGEPRERGMSANRSAESDCWKMSSQSNMVSSWEMVGWMSSTLGTTGTGSGMEVGTGVGVGITGVGTGVAGVGTVGIF